MSRITRQNTNVAAQAELKTQNDELKALNDELKAQNTEAQNTIATLEHIRETNADDMSALTQKIDELEADNRAHKTSLTQNKDEVEALKQEITGYVEEEQKHRRDITRLREEKEVIDAQLANLKGAASMDSDEKQRLQQSIDTLEADKEALQNNISQLLAHKRTLEAFKVTLETKIGMLTDKIESLDNDINVMGHHNEDLEAENQRLHKEARDLKEQVRGLQSELDASGANPKSADAEKLKAEIAVLKEEKASLHQKLRKSGVQATCTRTWLTTAGVHAAKKFCKVNNPCDLVNLFNADAKKDAGSPEGKYAKIITELISKKKLDKPRGKIEEVFVMDATAMRESAGKKIKALLKQHEQQMNHLAGTVFPYLGEDDGSLNDLCELFSEAIVPSTGRNGDSISTMMIYMWYIVTKPVPLKGLKKRSEGTPSAAGSVPARKYTEGQKYDWRVKQFLDPEHAEDYAKTYEGIVENTAATKESLYQVEAKDKKGNDILRFVTESEVLRKVSQQKKNGETPDDRDKAIVDLVIKRNKLRRKRGEYLDKLFEAERAYQPYQRQKTEVTAVGANEVRGNPDGACAPDGAHPMDVEDQSGSDVQTAALYANAANRMSAGPSNPDATEAMAVDAAEQLSSPVQDVLPAQSTGSPVTPGTGDDSDDEERKELNGMLFAD